MKRIFNSIYGSEFFQMHFDVSADVAVNRLNARVSRSGFFRIRDHVMVGTVTFDAVKIHRSENYVTNSFRPYFIGRFEDNKEGTVLTGTFRFHRLIQIFMSVWFLFVLMFPIIIIVGMEETADIKPSFLEGLFFSLGSVLMIAIAIGIVKLGQWISCNDKDWLKNKIMDAINREKII